jgi:alpha-mannosidase
MLTLEWRHRIEVFRRELKKCIYTPIEKISWNGFVTKEFLTPKQALSKKFKPMSTGTKWGDYWEYGWFKSTIILPKIVQNKRIHLEINLGGETLIYIDNKLIGSSMFMDRSLLTLSGKPDSRYEILTEVYAGHGPTPGGGGPVAEGRFYEKMPEAPLSIIGESTYGIWEEDLYQLWIDVETLWSLRENIDQQSLRMAKIDEGLMNFTYIFDPELPSNQRIQSSIDARKYLEPLLECKNGSTMPTMYAFGHAHIDVAWLWPFTQTFRKTAATFANQLTLMSQYPEYKFLQSQPQLFLWLKNLYPEVYEEVKKAIKKGQILPEGGMWIESDTNLPSGESLIRQFIYGKQFFKEEFGIDNELLWLPDVFGYSGSLPQIMRGCGIKYFSTAKIFWNYNGGETFPYNTFVWEGIDGSTILVHLCNDYNSQTLPANTILRWNERVQKNNISSRLYPFGYGDGGGGPVRDHIEYLRRQENLEGCPKVKIASPVQFFKELEKQGIPENKYIGELYFQAHRGTYTSQAHTKKDNRKSELLLREAEFWSAISAATNKYAYPLEQFKKLWQKVLLHQFHDILPGSSITRVYQEAEKTYEEIISTAYNLIEKSVSIMTKSKNGLSIFNSLSWTHPEVIALPKGIRYVENQKGEQFPFQKDNEITYIEIQLPSCGVTSLVPTDENKITKIDNEFVINEKEKSISIENSKLKLTLNNNGEIISIIDKETNFQITNGICNELHMYKDVPSSNDAWDIDSMYEHTPVNLEKSAKISILTRGPLFVKIHITKKILNSDLNQDIILYKGKRRIDFKTQIDWHEKHKMLKSCFPVNIYSNEAIHEIQFGYLSRPNHKSRQFDADRFEVSNHKWTALTEENRGCAILNDCKYGINVSGNSMNLTLLKSAIAPDPQADQGAHEFTYSFYFWNGPFIQSNVVQEAYRINCPATITEGICEEKSFFELNKNNIIIETVKYAEDNSGNIILRLYESMRTKTSVTLNINLPVKKLFLTDMLENNIKEIVLKENSVKLDFHPFEIKTLRLIKG